MLNPLTLCIVIPTDASLKAKVNDTMENLANSWKILEAFEVQVDQCRSKRDEFFHGYLWSTFPSNVGKQAMS